MSDGAYTLCPVCREQISEDEPGIVPAYEVVRTETFGGVEEAEGLGALFHAGCWPLAGPRYRRKG